MSSCVYRLKVPVYQELLHEKKAKISRDILNGKVRIIPKARNYLAMLEEVEKLPYFTKALWQNATVGQMNTDLRFSRSQTRAQIDLMSQLLKEIKEFKKRKGQISFFDKIVFPLLMAEETLLQRVASNPDKSMRETKEILVSLKRANQVQKFLQGMINNPRFFDSLY